MQRRAHTGSKYKEPPGHPGVQGHARVPGAAEASQEQHKQQAEAEILKQYSRFDSHPHKDLVHQIEQGNRSLSHTTGQIDQLDVTVAMVRASSAGATGARSPGSSGVDTLRAPGAGPKAPSRPGTQSAGRPRRIFTQGKRDKEEGESCAEDTGAQEVVPTTRQVIMAWTSSVATTSTHGPQGGMHAADPAAASTKSAGPDMSGVQLAGLPIEVGCIMPARRRGRW